MSAEQTIKFLDDLHVIEQELAEARESAKHEKAALLTAEQVEKFAEIDARLSAIESELAHRDESARSRVKVFVLASGKKVRGSHFQAFVTSRTSWDTKGLNGYAVANPDVLAFRSESQSVTIRKC